MVQEEEPRANQCSGGYTLSNLDQREQDQYAHLNCIQEAKLATSGIVEIVSPLRQRLQSVHHTSIVSISRGGEESTKPASIQKPQFHHNLSGLQQHNPSIESNKSKRIRQTHCRLFGKISIPPVAIPLSPGINEMVEAGAESIGCNGCNDNSSHGKYRSTTLRPGG